MDRPETKPPSPTSSSAYSSPSTQFIALSDDDINLWQAVAIVDERPTAFKEWADSWVAKCDVTPDMVDVWRVGHASVRSGSTSSRRKSRNKSKFSTATATSTVTKPRGFSESSAISNPNSKGKEKEKVVSDSEDEKDIDEITTILLPTSTVARPNFNTEYVLIQSDKNYKQMPDSRPRGDNSFHNPLSMAVDGTILNAQRGVSHKTPASAAPHVPHNSHNPLLLLSLFHEEKEKDKDKEREDDDDDEDNGNDAEDEYRPAVTPNSIVVTPVWKDGKIVRETFEFLESDAEFDKSRHRGRSGTAKCLIGTPPNRNCGRIQQRGYKTTLNGDYSCSNVSRIFCIITANLMILYQIKCSILARKTWRNWKKLPTA
ncbi:MAG: hypothetical protein NXY57DRAFT_1023141 [Lentinula lateritia]|nr:MAG: hypothetical protein NXY57DRAFT_1023141 [Lentinula lateritia]